jgi:hypothetical protein
MMKGNKKKIRVNTRNKNNKTKPSKIQKKIKK